MIKRANVTANERVDILFVFYKLETFVCWLKLNSKILLTHGSSTNFFIYKSIEKISKYYGNEMKIYTEKLILDLRIVRKRILYKEKLCLPIQFCS